MLHTAQDGCSQCPCDALVDWLGPVALKGEWRTPHGLTGPGFIDARAAALAEAEADYEVVAEQHRLSYERLMKARRRFNDAGRDWLRWASVAAITDARSEPEVEGETYA